MTFGLHFYTTYTVPPHKTKKPRFRPLQGFQTNYLRFLHAFLTLLILRKPLLSYIWSDAYWQAHRCQKMTCACPPILIPKYTQTLCRMIRSIYKTMINDQYLHMLALLHSSTSSCTSYLLGDTTLQCIEQLM